MNSSHDNIPLYTFSDIKKYQKEIWRLEDEKCELVIQILELKRRINSEEINRVLVRSHN
jgi:hypothetical protein